MLCSKVQGKMQSPLFSAALQKRLTAGSVSLHLHLWRFALHTGVQWQITNPLQQGSGQNAIPTVQCCSAKEAHSRQCVTALTPMEICSSYRCPVAHHKCSAALFSAKWNPHCSVLLCKRGSQQAVCHCTYTYGDLLFIQVSSGTSQMPCNTVQGKMQSPLFSAALQKRLTAGSVSLQLHLLRFALHTGVQWHITYALQHCSGQNAIPTVQCCSAKQAHSRQCVTALTPMEICSSYRCPVAHHKCSAARFRAKWNPHCSVLLCKRGSQQAVCQCNYTYGDVHFIQVCSDPAPVHCNTVSGKMQSPLFSAALQKRLTAGSVSLQLHLLRFALHTGVQWHITYALQHCSGQNAIPTVQCCSAKQAHSRQCVTALTPMEICSSYRCPVAHHKCSAARFRAKWNPHCSVLLCKRGSQQAVCQCNYTYGDVHFIQVCSDPAPVHCNTVSGKMQSPLFSAALQKRLTAGSVSLQLHLLRFALHTGVQWHITYALQHCSGQNAIPTVQCCSAKQAHSRQCVTALTPMEICSSYRCPVAHHKCSAARFRAKWNPHCSVLLCKRGSQQAVCQCNYTYGDVHFIQVCSDPAPVHCNTVSGKIQSPMFNAAVQNRFTAGVCQCNYTYGDLLSIQVCSEPTEMHSTLFLAKCNPPCSMQLCKTGSQQVVSVQLHLWRCALHTGVQ